VVVKHTKSSFLHFFSSGRIKGQEDFILSIAPLCGNIRKREKKTKKKAFKSAFSLLK